MVGWTTQAFRLNSREGKKHSEMLSFGEGAASALVIREEPFVIVAHHCVSCVNKQPLFADTVSPVTILATAPYGVTHALG
jgi:hypothetical protein